MFDALLKSKFYSKCKTDLKLIRTRIDIIKKKRNATQKYLRKDVADLLKDGLDQNAYGRTEGLIAEMVILLVQHSMSINMKQPLKNNGKKEGYIAIRQKPFNNSCYYSREKGAHPPMCEPDDDPDKV